MSNRFKLKNGVLTLVNEKDEVVYESKPTPIKKSLLDKTADFIQNLPEIPTPSFLKLSPESDSADKESENKAADKKEEAITTEVSTESTPITDDVKTKETSQTPETPVEILVQDEPSSVSTDQPTQLEANVVTERTKVPTVAEVVIETKVG